MRSELKTHEDIKINLENLGWKPLKRVDLGEGEFLLTELLREKLEELNREEFKFHGLKPEEKEKFIDEAIKKLQYEADPKNILDYLKYGLNVTVNFGSKGNFTINFKLIDFENPERNAFNYIYEQDFKGRYTIRPDFTLFINGIPIAIIEAKREIAEGETHLEGVKQIDRYEKEAPGLFKFVQLAIVIADEDLYVATYPNPYSERRPKRKPNVWKDANGKPNIWELLNPYTLIDIIENFINFFGDKDGYTKLIARYMQYRAVNKVFKRIKDYLEGKTDKRKGLIWHWQGSGKTLEIAFLAQKFYKKFYSRKPIVLIMVDRRELESQFDEFFNKLQNTPFKGLYKKINTVEELIELIKQIKESERNPNVAKAGVYLVMIHKFRKEILNKLPNVELNKKEILILRDEAHRTEGGKNAVYSAIRNKIFKNAIMVGFTGTPVHRAENSTFEAFAYPLEGEFYLDRYFIENSINDGFTVPLTFRVALTDTIENYLNQEDIKELIKEWFVSLEGEEGEEDEEIEQLRTSKREASKFLPLKEIFTSNNYINRAVEYIAKHLKEDTENFTYKVMIIAQDRLSAVRFKEWLDQIAPQYIPEYTPEWSRVVITYTNNDEEEIKEYRKRLEEEFNTQKVEDINKKIVELFKNKENPKILIVNKRLLTGFDAPILKVLYIAQVLKDVTLLQASARVNRLYPGKRYGLVVDLTGFIIDNYRKAIAQYNLYNDHAINEDILKNLFKDSEEIWELFLEKLKELKQLFEEVVGLDLDSWRKKINTAPSKDAKKLFNDTVDKVIATEKGLYKLYPLLKEVIKLYETLGAYPKKIDYREVYIDLKTLSAAINKKLNPRSAVKLPEEVKEELLEGLDFGEFKTLNEIEFNENLIRILESEEVEVKIYSNWLLPLIRILQEEQDEPIYKALYERLKQVQEQFIKGTISVKDLIETLKENIKDLTEYRKTVATLNPTDRIMKNLAIFLKAYNYDNVKFVEGLKRALDKLLVGRPTESIKAEIRKHLKTSLILSRVPKEEREQMVNLLMSKVIIPLYWKFKEEV